jgi:type IV pilus assembly protein PilA
MGPGMVRLALTTLACAALLVLPGCGSSEKPAAPEASQAQQDAQAKSDARNLVTYVETCYTDYGSYEQCGLAADGTVDGQDTQLTDASASRTDVTAQGYVVTTKSESGNSFSIKKADGGAVARACSPAGQGGCPASGAW